MFKSLPKDKILDLSKLQAFNNGVENIVRQGEIACYKQFLLFSQCFPQLYILNASKCSIVWQWVNIIIILYPITKKENVTCICVVGPSDSCWQEMEFENQAKEEQNKERPGCF